MTFAAFMELALYHPKVGYYRDVGSNVHVDAGTQGTIDLEVSRDWASY